MGFGLSSIFKPAASFLGLNQGADEANKFSKNQLDRILGMLGQQGQQDQLLFAKAAAGQRAALPLVKKAYGDARANTVDLADATKRELLAREPSAMAGADANLFGRGYGASNLVGLAHRGIRGDTARALGEIDRMFGQQLDQLGVGEANDTASIQGRASGYDAQLASLLSQLRLGGASAVGQQQHQNAAGIGELLGLGGQIAALANGVGKAG